VVPSDDSPNRSPGDDVLLKMRFKIDPYAWNGADGDFEVNVIVGDAPDWSGMSRRVGLDIYSTQPGTVWAGLIGGWSSPYQQVSVSSNTWYRYRLRIEPTQVSHKIWLDGDPEPPAWTAVTVAPQGQSLTFTPSHLWIYNANYGVKLYLDWIGLRS
jgi:hypothetical protein